MKMTQDVAGLFQEAQDCAVVLCSVSEAQVLLKLLVPQDLQATVDRLKDRYRLHAADLRLGNVALIVLRRYVEELHDTMGECMLDGATPSLGTLAGIYLASRLTRDGGHVVN